VDPEAQAADAAAGGIRVTSAFVSRGVTAYGLWINWKACIESYPEVTPLFQACGDQRYVRLQPACELQPFGFVKRTGLKGGGLDRVNLAQQFIWGHNVFEAGNPLSKVGQNMTVPSIAPMEFIN
jgi:hypothetical protein